MGRRPCTTWLALGVLAACLAPVTSWLEPTLAASKGAGSTNAAQPAPMPKLVVLMVVDQMRADYIDRFREQWDSGLKRLVTRGAWFSNAAYPYLATLTCVGHATISTGVFPNRHGVILNTWFDRKERRVVTCTEDPRTTIVSYGGTGGPGDSAVRLRVPTFADAMRTQRGARVVSLSLKARSAIMLAGHGGEAVTWLNESLDGWETSSAYGAAVPAVQRFVDANPIDADFRKSWTRLLAPSQYQSDDALVGEAPPRGWTAVFPHVLAEGSEGIPDQVFHTQWERSPFADEYLGRFAGVLVDLLQLGQREATDVLAISFSSPDLVGHAFGPRSQELQDTYARLDRTIGALLDRLDALVGADRYVLGLSADHGVAEIPEQLTRAGKEGGRLSSRGIAALVEAKAQAAGGRGRYVSAVSGGDVHFEPGMFDRLNSKPGAVNAVMRELSAQPGIARVFRGSQLARSTSSRDPLTRAAALSAFPDMSGELVFALKPGWMLAVTGTTHGSANPDDQRVPIVLYGSGVKTGLYRESATPADIAPTLAALVGLTMPDVDGRVLRSALSEAPYAASTRR